MQRICLDASKSHPIPLAEAVGYLNKQNLVHLSRGVLYFNALEETAIHADVRDPSEPISKKSRATFFDERRSDPKFIQAVQLYEDALASSSDAQQSPPYHKHPAQLSLYEYLTFFDKDWIAVSPMPIVVIMPHIPFTPQKSDSCPYFRKFCIVMLRMHYVDVLPLDQLQQWSTEQLRTKCDTVFTLGSTALWIVEQWLGLHQYRPFEVPNAPPTPASGTPDDLDGSLGRLLDVSPVAVPTEDIDDCLDDLLAMDEDDVEFGQDEGNARIDYLADIQRLGLQHWTSATGEIQRRELLHPRAAAIPGADGSNSDERPLTLSNLNPKQRTAVNLVVKLARPMFTEGRQFFVEICGAAGTGKTVVMQVLKQQLIGLIGEVCPEGTVFGRRVRFAAPTGTAAKLLPSPTATLHSLLGIPINFKKGLETPKLSNNALKRLQQDLEHLSLLVIDEKSFIGLRLLYNVHVNLQQIMQRPNLPFGGVSIVLLGDHMQLAPVKDLSLCTDPSVSEQNRKNKIQLTIFDRVALTLYHEYLWEVVILETLCRQSVDSPFATLLDTFRAGQFSAQDWELLRKRSLSELPPAERAEFGDQAVKVCALKRDFELFTKQKIAQLAGQKVFLKSVNNPPVAIKASSSTAGGLPRNLLLVNGMRVMLTVNLSIECGLTNGSLGTIVGILFFKNQVQSESNQSPNDLPTILVKFDKYRGHSVVNADGEDLGVPIDALSRTWYEGKVPFQRTMVPLVPAYAFSIHKAQGQTLDKMVLNVGKKEFAAGLVYTALTRARALEQIAFDPMPFVTRFQVQGTKGFKLQKKDMERKQRMQESTLARHADIVDNPNDHPM